MNIEFRFAELADLPRIIEIYNSTVAGRMVTADTEPVSVESKLAWFNAHNRTTHPLWVAENQNHEIVGWASYQPFHTRPAYSGTAQIGIYLHENFRGRGLGKIVLQYALRSAPAFGIHSVLGYIFAHNEPSIKLFTQEGFKEWAFFPDVAVIDGNNVSLKIFGVKT